MDRLILNHLHAQIGTPLSLGIHHNLIRLNRQVISQTVVLLHTDFLHNILNGRYMNFLLVVKKTVESILEDHARLAIEAVL